MGCRRLRGLTIAAAATLELFANPDPAVTRPAPSQPVMRVYHTTRLNGPAPVVDGRLDDRCWKEQGEWTGSFTQREPREGAKPTLPTEVKVLYDDSAIYVAIRAFDPEVATRPRVIGARDQFTGDMVGINFDSYHDQRAGFEFDLTSGGSKIDLILKDDGSVDTSWNATWDGKTAFEPDAWTAEFRIPLSQLRYQRGSPQVWGMHCWRWIAAVSEESDWNLLPMDFHGMIHSFGELRGLDGLPAPRRLEIVPFAIAKLHRYAPEAGNPFRTGSERDLNGGVDVKYGLSTNLTLDLTANPDFSQVDADPSEINLTTVETFHSERRPFFLEGKGTFDFQLDDDAVFYSRRIGAAPRLSAPDGVMHDTPEATRILGSAKLTGTTSSGLTVGILDAALDRVVARTYGADGFRRVTIEPRSNDAVVRLQQEIAHGNAFVGTILSSTLRSGDDAELQTLPRRSLLAGVDAIGCFSNRTYFAEGRVLATQVDGSTRAISHLVQEPEHNFQRPDADYLGVDPAATRLAGNAGILRAGRATGLWRGNGFVSWRSPGVDFNDLGYMQTADLIVPGVQLEYFNAAAGTRLRRRDVKLKVTAPYDYGREALGRNAYLQGEFATISGAYLWSRVGVEHANLDPHVLRGGPALRLADRFPVDAYAETPGGRSLQWRANIGASTSAEGARSFRLAPSVTWKPVNQIESSLTIDYTGNRDPSQYAGSTSANGAPVYLMARLRQHVLSTIFRVAANFTPTLSLSYFGGPFATSGRYSDFKVVDQPRARSADQRLSPLGLKASGGVGNYRGASINVPNPNFDWREFKSNLVLRWEYRPGSSLYCVWSQYRSDVENIGGFSPLPQYRQLYAAHPDNTLLVKVSYWFSL